MQTVITEALARKLTGGRRPLVPIEYDQACTALEACLTLDEAKYWSDKASALAAWAKIYHADKILTDAKRLKLKAYRRMGELAAELQPPYLHRQRNEDGTLGGHPPGPVALLQKHGLKHHEATSARLLARMSPERFVALINVPRPPSPTSMAIRGYNSANPSYALLLLGMKQLHFRIRQVPAAELSQSFSIKGGEAASIKKIAIELIEWLDEFERHLPKR